MRLMDRCNNNQTRTQATIACSNVQRCTGLRSGTKGNLHAVRTIWPQSADWTHDGDILGKNDDEDLDDGTAMATQPSQVEDSCAADNPLIHTRADKDDKYSRYKEGSGYGMVLFDAKCIM